MIQYRMKTRTYQSLLLRLINVAVSCYSAANSCDLNEAL